MKTTTWFDAGTFAIGSIVLLGRFHGAICNRYRVASRKDANHVELVSVIARSVRNADNTFSTVFEDA